MEDQDLKAKEAMTRTRLWLIGIGVCELAALAAPILALIEVWKPGDISLAEWFSRSGSISSIFALLAGVRLTHYRAEFEGSGLADLHLTNAFKHYRRWYDAFNRGFVLLAVTGSLVWGYGDILVNAVT